MQLVRVLLAIVALFTVASARAPKTVKAPKGELCPFGGQSGVIPLAPKHKTDKFRDYGFDTSAAIAGDDRQNQKVVVFNAKAKKNQAGTLEMVQVAVTRKRGARRVGVLLTSGTEVDMVDCSAVTKGKYAELETDGGGVCYAPIQKEAIKVCKYMLAQTDVKAVGGGGKITKKTIAISQLNTAKAVAELGIKAKDFAKVRINNKTGSEKAKEGGKQNSAVGGVGVGKVKIDVKGDKVTGKVFTQQESQAPKKKRLQTNQLSISLHSSSGNRNSFSSHFGTVFGSRFGGDDDDEDDDDKK